MTDDELAQLIEFVARVNELNLTEKDEQILRHLLTLIASWKLRAFMLKKKELKIEKSIFDKETELLQKFKKKELLISKGMTFSNAENKMREYSR